MDNSSRPSQPFLQTNHLLSLTTSVNALGLIDETKSSSESARISGVMVPKHQIQSSTKKRQHKRSLPDAAELLLRNGGGSMGGIPINRPPGLL